ncbi:hypothetical protein [Pandoraea horticolens]|uniref:hypothetical protein n=1 Tax=Pandoraea horticolens TaxID=2508298 RepID=UPI00123F3850|nr:hypothetical protein [Pandoraea horticolens]
MTKEKKMKELIGKYHFLIRHVISGGYCDATAVQKAVTGDLSDIGASLPHGQYTGTVVVYGTTSTTVPTALWAA